MVGKGERVRAMFDEITGLYDAMNAFMSLGMDTRWRRLLVDRVSLPSGGVLLDVCCGTGDVVLEAAGRLNGRGRVTGLDFSRGMLDRARIKADRSGVGGMVDLVAGDAMDLPFPDGSFEAVTVAFGLRNVEDIPKALREAHRVLKPGGRFACLDLSRPVLPVFKELYGIYFGTIVPFVGRLVLGRGGAYDYLPASLEGFPIRGELEAALAAAGFGDTGYTELALGTAAIHHGTKALRR